MPAGTRCDSGSCSYGQYRQPAPGVLHGTLVLRYKPSPPEFSILIFSISRFRVPLAQMPDRHLRNFRMSVSQAQAQNRGRPSHSLCFSVPKTDVDIVFFVHSKSRALRTIITQHPHNGKVVNISDDQ